MGPTSWQSSTQNVGQNQMWMSTSKHAPNAFVCCRYSVSKVPQTCKPATPAGDQVINISFYRIKRELPPIYQCQKNFYLQQNRGRYFFCLFLRFLPQIFDMGDNSNRIFWIKKEKCCGFLWNWFVRGNINSEKEENKKLKDCIELVEYGFHWIPEVYVIKGYLWSVLNSLGTHRNESIPP